jgi:electron transport complex protein RnfD
LAVSAPPHLRGRWSVPRMMLLTCASLVPAVAVSAARNGFSVPAVIAVAVAAALAAEGVFRLAAGKRRPWKVDGSACLTGLLLAGSLPPQVPLWVPAVGAVFAIVIVKEAFGGLGRNFLNPALAGRAFCALAFPAVWNAALPPPVTFPGGTLLPLVTGVQGGWIGGSSAAALLAGAALLRGLRIIDVTLPVSFIVTSFLLFLPWHEGVGEAVMQVAAGGTLFCALFMATDPVTSPRTFFARLLSGAGCGALAFLFREAGACGDGVMYAVLLMNCVALFLDRWCGRLSRTVTGGTGA